MPGKGSWILVQISGNTLEGLNDLTCFQDVTAICLKTKEGRLARVKAVHAKQASVVRGDIDKGT